VGTQQLSKTKNENDLVLCYSRIDSALLRFGTKDATE